MSFPNKNRVVPIPREYFHLIGYIRNAGCPDEHPGEAVGFRFPGRDSHFGGEFCGQAHIPLETLALSTVRVSPDSHLEAADSRLVAFLDMLGEKNGTGARSEYRHPVIDTIDDFTEKTKPFAQHPDRRTLTARDDQRVDIRELLGGAHTDDVHSGVQKR